MKTDSGSFLRRLGDKGLRVTPRRSPPLGMTRRSPIRRIISSGLRFGTLIGKGHPDHVIPEVEGTLNLVDSRRGQPEDLGLGERNG